MVGESCWCRTALTVELDMNFGERRKHIADHLTRWAYTQHVYKVPSREVTDHLIDFLATEWAAEEEINIDRDIQPILDNHFPLTIPPPAPPYRRWTR
jgi:hypothetical protein